jgi:hypothetical protein
MLSICKSLQVIFNASKMICAQDYVVLFAGTTNYLNKEAKVHVTGIETEAVAVPKVHLLLQEEMMAILVEGNECYIN